MPHDTSSITAPATPTAASTSTPSTTTRRGGPTSPVAAAQAMLCVPRAAAASSFVLHASLNLVARAGLLPYLDPAARGVALERIEELAEQFAAAGDPVEEPPARRFESVPVAAARLADAIGCGDLDEVDAVAAWLADHLSAVEAGAVLGEAVVDSLAAAGHAPIGLHLLRRVPGEWSVGLLRGPLRELARHPDWRLTWFRARPADISDHAGANVLAAALRAIPYLGRPGSDFIFPLMSQTEQSGVAAQAIGPALGLPVAEARNVLLRAAAWSMVHDDASQAPYGWSHCLTMPQGVLALAARGVAPRTAVAVAGTFVAGFRAASGLVPLGSLDDDASDDTGGVPATGPSAALASRAMGVVTPAIGELAAFAAAHHDEHLVKYTLACLHAAEDDPAWAGGYLAAAAHLADWWRTQPTSPD